MLCSGLTATLMIIINGIALTHSSPGKEVDQRADGTAVSSRVSLRHIPDRSNYYLYVATENGVLSKRIRNWHSLVRELESVLLKLRNVVGKYDKNKEELKELYPGVAACGRGNCGKFHYLLPENKELERFYCKKFKKPNGLKKQTSKLLSFLHEGVHNIEESFQLLINFQKMPYFKKRDLSNGKRLRILNEFYTDVKTLNLEIIERLNVTANKRLNPRGSAMAMRHPKSQTDLMIYEWRIIQQSKEFLEKWRKHIEKVFKCWEKKSRKTFRKHLLRKKNKLKPQQKYLTLPTGEADDSSQKL